MTDLPLPPADSAADRARLIHREFVQLVQLGLVVVAAFVGVRSLAAINRETMWQNGATWYARGHELLAAGRVEAATDAYRRAVATNRADARYALGLADALVRAHHNAAAQGVLLNVRESRPEDPEVNLRLARLAAARADRSAAVTFYHNALYAPWPDDAAEQRRTVRLELVDLLLAHQQRDAALAELVALGTDLPEEKGAQLALAARFAKAGDHRNALLQCQRALRVAPRDPTVLSAAAQSAFELGDYLLARRYFRGVPALEGAAAATRDLTELIIATDPLAARLGAAERRRRLSANLAYARQRLGACMTGTTADLNVGGTPSLQDRGVALDRQLRTRAAADMDAIEDGMELIAQVLDTAIRRCPPASPRDRALRIVAERHGGNRP